MVKARTILYAPILVSEELIQLELSKDEAEALLTVFGHVGGRGYEGQPRFHITAIYKALTELGVVPKYAASGSVYFEETSE
jgi:hypothetical protein